ncbi:ankyrin unc44 [Colletotrichum plurivorum]|uniref:Ankyrin unc44 n=1 Tax=Colletotrichum plurivorum TaxID=2175906 RepID=A0A8H6N7I4_9PEZI|nr:ankyrin unc44 [Colletotrichum plurivorum]
MQLSEALAEARAQTEAVYRSNLQSATGKPGQLRSVTTTLRLLCGTLHSLCLLVDELQLEDGEASFQNPSLPPDRSLLGTLAATLDELRQHGYNLVMDNRIPHVLRQLLNKFRTAEANTSLPGLMASLSSAGIPELPPKLSSDEGSSSIRNDLDVGGLTNNDSLSAARACLDELLGEVAASRPAEYYAYRHHVRERDVTHPSYAPSALRLPYFAEKYWAELRPDLQRLFDPKKTANFEHWVLEYARQQWPDRFDVASGAISTTPLTNLMAAVSAPSLRTLHVAAALGLPSLCQWLMSEADREAVNRRSPLGMACYCALLGPTALLARTDDPMKVAVDMVPSPHRADTITLLIDSLRETDPKAIGPGQYEHFSVVTMAFLVCHSLSDPGLFLRMACDLDQRFVQLFKGDAAIDAYWPSQLPQLSHSFLDEVLPHLLDRSIEAYDDDSYDGDMSLTADAVCHIIDHFGLKCSAAGCGSRPLSITDDRFIDLVREAVQDCELGVVRRLIQDPRWDPNAFITGDIATSMSDGDDAQPQPIKGATLLHSAVESNMFELVEAILKSGEEVNVHARNCNDQTPLMLSESPEVCRILLDHGARTTDTDDCGRNVWHFAAANSDIPLIDCLNKHDEHRDQNLRGLMDEGQTPIAQAAIYPFMLQRKGCKANDKPPLAALHMLSICKKDSTYLQSPTPLLFIAAAWGSEPLASRLIEFGVDASFVDNTGRSALHWMNESATPELVLTLQRACRAPLQTLEGLTPADTILDDPAEIASCPRGVLNIPSNNRFFIKLDAFKLLLTSDTLSSRDKAGAGLWERFATNIVPRWRKLGLSVSIAAEGLRSVGAVARYEDEHQKCALIPVIQALIADYEAQRNSQCFLEAMMADILDTSSQTSSFMQSTEAVQCFRISIQHEYCLLAQKLLDLGVPVQKRCDGTTLLEDACQPHTKYSTTMLMKMLDHADAGRLNEVDEKGVGLLRRLQDPNVTYQRHRLKVLLKKGLDPNFMTPACKEPLLLGFIEDSQVITTSMMLDHGADPTATNSWGQNAVHVAAARGCISILERIEALEGEYDWTPRCTYRYRSRLRQNNPPDDVFARGCTALHLAAAEGHASVMPILLRAFGQDVNVMTLDSRWTPLHYASLLYSGDCVRWLLEHGADPFAEDFQGITPLMLAVRHDRSNPVGVFLELRPRSDKGWMHLLRDAFAIAVKIGSQNMTDLLKPLVMSQASDPLDLLAESDSRERRESIGVVSESS